MQFRNFVVLSPLMTNEYYLDTLPSGLRIITVPLPNSATATVLTLVGTGSDYELPHENGISHFLEHMYFKGTIKRPTAQAVSLELDSLGAESNAFTDHEITGYYAKGDARHWKNFLDIVADIYLNSTLSETEIEKEKGVICEEINMYEDMPQSVIHEKFEHFIYGDQKAGRPIIGTKELVRSFTRDMFLDYQARRYSPQNTVIVISGPVDREDAVKEVSGYFNDYVGVQIPPRELVSFPQNSEKVLAIPDATDQVHAIIGFHGFPRGTVEAKKARMVGGVLGAGMSSRLFQLLREELGVCYYVSAGLSARTHSGVFNIVAGITKEKAEMAIERILEECKKLCNELVSEAELLKVKNYLSGTTKLKLESSDDRAVFYGFQAILDNEIKTIDEKIAEIENITVEDIKSIASQIFTKDRMSIGYIGPEGVIQSHENILLKI